MAPFTNPARSDDLVLYHWQRKQDPINVPAPDASGMETDEKKESEEAPKPREQEYSFAKYNVKARVPRRYTDEEYAQRLGSDDWSRQETDYLMDLVEEYDLRWIVIADRYDYQAEHVDEEANATALVPAKRRRTMEEMKARYYSVAATMLAIEHPPSEMSETEFDLHEKMLKFDADRERSRKELAALQLNRTSDEVREEGILLEELKRITANEQNFITDRRELYSRLEVPISVGNTAMYQSSQGLSQLLQTLLQFAALFHHLIFLLDVLIFRRIGERILVLEVVFRLLLARLVLALLLLHGLLRRGDFLLISIRARGSLPAAARCGGRGIGGRRIAPPLAPLSRRSHVAFHLFCNSRSEGRSEMRRSCSVEERKCRRYCSFFFLSRQEKKFKKKMERQIRWT